MVQVEHFVMSFTSSDRHSLAASARTQLRAQSSNAAGTGRLQALGVALLPEPVSVLSTSSATTFMRTGGGLVGKPTGLNNHTCPPVIASWILTQTKRSGWKAGVDAQV